MGSTSLLAAREFDAILCTTVSIVANARGPGQPLGSLLKAVTVFELLCIGRDVKHWQRV
jgi:hypothetical protein